MKRIIAALMLGIVSLILVLPGFADEVGYGGSVVFEENGMRTPRYSHHSVLLRDGRLMVIGGLDEDEMPMRLCEIYDPVKKTWSRTGNLRKARWAIPPRFSFPNGPSSTATVLLDGRILVTGGIERGSLNLIRTAEIWDPETGQWELLPNEMFSMRANHAATLMGDGRVFISGGQDFNSIFFQNESFDPETNTFRLEGAPDAVTVNRRNHRSIFVPIPGRPTEGHVLILGGLNANTFTPLRTNLAFDPAAPRDSAYFEIPDMSTVRYNFGVTPLSTGDSVALCVGGRITSNTSASTNRVDLLERDANGQFRWREVDPIPRRVSHPRLAFIESSLGPHVLSIGGRDDATGLAGIFQFDLMREIWCRTGTALNEAVLLHAVSVDPFTRKIYVTGGARRTSANPSTTVGTFFHSGGVSLRLANEGETEVVEPGGTLVLDAYIGNLTPDQVEFQNVELTLDEPTLFGLESSRLGQRRNFSLGAQAERRKTFSFDVPVTATNGNYTLILTARFRNGLVTTEGLQFTVERP